MSYAGAGANAANKVKAKRSKKYKLTNLGPTQQFLDIQIHPDGSSASLGQKAFRITILRQFSMEHTHNDSTAKHPNV